MEVNVYYENHHTSSILDLTLESNIKRNVCAVQAQMNCKGKNMIVNERISAYINSLEEELPEYLDQLELRAIKDGVPIIRKEAQSLLRFLLEIKKPNQILEVGTAVGFSCSLLSEYMPIDCKITTIEKVPTRIAEAKKNLSKARRAEDILFFIGDAIDVLQVMNGNQELSISEIYYPGKQESRYDVKTDEKDEFAKTYDFIFMDAAKGQYMNFLPEIMKLLGKDGILITDNVLQEGSIAESKYSITRRDRTIHTRMREYLYALTHMEELKTVVLPVGDGMTISTKLN